MSKKIVIVSLVIMLCLIFTGISYAAENPFKGLTEEQIIQKYFEGRQSDPIEGIWYSWRTVVIIKTSAMDTINDFKDYDYILVEYSTDPQKAEIFGVGKTEKPHIYSYGKWNRILRQISPTTLVWTAHSYQNPESLFITRIYPSDLK